MNMAVKKPELLSPAGDMERLIMALHYGADAVYLSGTRFGMRAAAGNFSDEALRKAVELCHERGVKTYVACNTVLRDSDFDVLPDYLVRLQEAGADAVIVSDLGVMAMVKKYAPLLKLHVSTQAGIMSSESAKAFFDLGASRVVLARELTLSEIAGIRSKTPPELDLEAFVHGSMCVSFSGRCLLSNYLTGRDANSGQCSQPCRWKYHLVEERRPGELMRLTEDNGTYIFNSRDLCMIDHIPELLSAGISSLKIEGRQKSFYYTAVVTNAYRHALDAAMKGHALERIWSEEVNKVSHREYSTGFYFDAGGPGQCYADSMYTSVCDVVAVVESCDSDGNAVLTQRNRFFKGDSLELLTPSGEPIELTAAYIQNAEGEELDSAPHPMMTVRMKLPANTPQYSVLRKKRPADPE